MTSGTGHNRATVLVVEDLRDPALVLCSVLDAAGFDARIVGRSMVERALLREPVAAVLVSLSGAGVGAASDLVSRLRRRPEPPLSHAAIVALVDEEFDLFFGLGNEADVSLERPVRADTLIEAVTEVASTHRSVRQMRLQASR